MADRTAPSERRRPWWRRLTGGRRGAALDTDETDAVPGADALADENARLRRAVAELSVINDTAREIAGSLDSSVVIDRIIHRARKAVHAEQAVVVLIDRADSDVARTLVRSITLNGREDIWHLDQQLLGWMSTHERPLLSNAPQQDDRLAFAQVPEGVRHLLCVPMQVRGELIGVLSAVNRHDGDGFGEHDQRLLGIIAAQSAQVVEAARLYEHERALADMQEELRAARRIQQHLLPASLPAVPGCDLAASLHAAGEVGGDCYDCLTTTAGGLALCLIDVSGKGVPAALLAANLHAACRTRLAAGDRPAACLTHLNEHLLATSALGEFASCFLGVLDPVDHRFVFSSAGHEPVLLVRRDTASPEHLATGNLLLGIRIDHAYGEGDIQLAPGDVVVAYTDGITDVFDDAGDRFGADRLAAVVHRERGGSAAAIVAAIEAAVAAHAGSSQQPDDRALVVLSRLE